MLTYTTTMDNPNTYRATVSGPAQDIYHAIKGRSYNYVLYDDSGKQIQTRTIDLQSKMFNSEMNSYIIARPKTAENIQCWLRFKNTALIFSNFAISQLLYTLVKKLDNPELSVLGDGTGTSICGHGYFKALPGFDEAVGLCSLAYYTC